MRDIISVIICCMLLTYSCYSLWCEIGRKANLEDRVGKLMGDTTLLKDRINELDLLVDDIERDTTTGSIRTYPNRCVSIGGSLCLMTKKK